MMLSRWVAALLLAMTAPLTAQEPAEPPAQGESPQASDAPAVEDAGNPLNQVTRASDLNFQIGDARAAQIPTEHFASRSAYRSFSMSPDGRHLLAKVGNDFSSALVLIDAERLVVTQTYQVPNGNEIDWYRWAGNDKIIMSLSTVAVRGRVQQSYNRLFVRSIVKRDEAFFLETPRRNFWGGEVIHIDDDGRFALVSMQRHRGDDPSVYRYELVAGAERERIVRPRGGVWNWYADDDGVVRLGTGWRDRRLRIYYRDSEDADFELVEKLKRGDDRARFWNVVRIISGSDQGYVLEENDAGRIGVRLFNYSTGETLETFYENPDWDVQELWLKSDGTPMAAFYTDDRDQIEWFDEEMGTLHRRLRAALGQEELHIVTRSRNNERMLVWAGNESDPGALYVLTPETRELALLTNYRPELDFRELVRPVPLRYQARDGLMISAYLTVPRGVEPKDLPLIIMPHGGPFGVRDKLEYNDEVQLLANRGYAVLQPNFRGSGGYGEAFYEEGFGEVGRGMQDDIDDAMDWAVREGIADPARVCVVGGSYGGFAALWAVISNPERYRCAASWAGVTDWDRMMSYDRRYLGRERARDLRRREEGEDADLDDYSPVNQGEFLSRPVLLAHGSKDRRVPSAQFDAFVRATKDAPVRPDTLFIEGEGHSFSKSENEQKWYDALIEFLAEHNPADEYEAPSQAAAATAAPSVEVDAGHETPARELRPAEQ